MPEDYDTLQDAVDFAENGDTILVGDGVWTGSNNRDVNFGRKRLHIRSVNGPANCIIDCEGLGSGFVEPWTPDADWGAVVVVPGPGPVNGPVVRSSAAQWLAYGTLGHGLNITSGDLDGFRRSGGGGFRCGLS